MAKIPSKYPGKVAKLLYGADEICQVGEPLLELEVSDDIKVKEVVKHKEHAAAPAEHKPAPKAASGKKDPLIL